MREWFFIIQLVHAARAGILEVPVLRILAKSSGYLEIDPVEYFQVNVECVAELAA